MDLFSIGTHLFFANNQGGIRSLLFWHLQRLLSIWSKHNPAVIILTLSSCDLMNTVNAKIEINEVSSIVVVNKYCSYWNKSEYSLWVFENYSMHTLLWRYFRGYSVQQWIDNRLVGLTLALGEHMGYIQRKFLFGLFRVLQSHCKRF